MSSKLTPTPKVSAAVIGGIVASAILANITLITPDLFDGLGKWSGLVYGLTITLVMGAAGWLKSEGDTPVADEAATPAEAHTAATISAAPAAVFPAAKVEAAIAAPVVEPVAVTPVFEAPAVDPAAPVAPVA